MENPGTKLILRLKKSWIIYELERIGIDTKGTKLILARRLAKYKSKKEQEAWKAISTSIRRNS